MIRRDPFLVPVLKAVLIFFACEFEFWFVYYLASGLMH